MTMKIKLSIYDFCVSLHAQQQASYERLSPAPRDLSNTCATVFVNEILELTATVVCVLKPVNKIEWCSFVSKEEKKQIIKF